jgi:hypothetical protein
MVHRLLAQTAKAASIVLLPMPGLVPHDHVPDEHRLEGFSHALSRQLPGEPPGQAYIETGHLFEARPALSDPLEVVVLQGLRHECRCLPAAPPDRPFAPVTVFKGAPGSLPLLLRLLLLLQLLPWLLHLLLGRLRQLCKQPLEAEQGSVHG